MNQTLSIPHDFEAEQAILGSVISQNKLGYEVAEILVIESFFSEPHRYIFKAMLELITLAQPIDEIILGDQLKALGKLEEVGGYAYLAELVECAPSVGNIIYYAHIVKEHALLRDLISTTSEIARKSRDPKQNVNDLLIEAKNKIREIADRRGSERIKHIKDVLEDNHKKIESMANNESEPALMTGFDDLDKLTGGLYPGDLIIVAGRPGMGKSILALNILVNVCSSLKTERKKGLLFSLEMQKSKLAKRALASSGSINSYFLKTGKTSRQEDWDNLTKYTGELSKTDIWFDDKTRKIDEIVFTSHSMHRKHGLDLIAVDYLQKVDGTKSFREQEVTEISGKLKNLAMDLNLPVLAMCQLNRALESRPDKRPILSDLRESGSIEQDADVILFIYRDDYYNPDTSRKAGAAEIIAAKVRDGPTGMSELKFVGKYTRFENIQKYGI